MDTSNFEPPRIVASEKVFAGRVFDVTVDSVREADKTYLREVVHHKGSAVILPAFDDGAIALVRQYRHPAAKYLLELPAVTIDDQDRVEDGATRKLVDEVGRRAGRVEHLSAFFVRPGF